ncbi:hypothetical protein CVD28_01970 [Bacillus sp. M6-12]|uniref:hypothetical protein n=1 Tax=Bacillus sp. M6-12 TaxID=2054166 RepID=UPI000C783E42|nr:hypothetical protein [Bacillus sp. M6-12]PLS19199.1 hypothetical protein CVD28_01970 [Bacillus sp. M6-12]
MKKMLLLTNYEEIKKTVPEMEEKMKYYPEPFVFLVDDIVTMIGEIRITEEDICIKMVESMDKGKGHGREFIEFLKELPDKEEIWGESVVPAIPFWSKMGAEFNSTLYKQYEESVVNGEELEEDFLLPFTIYCQTLEPTH